MKPIETKPQNLRKMMAAAQEKHSYKVETAIMEFTEDMVRMMNETGTTKSELARKINVHPAYITKILRGTSNFTLDTMVKIATALGCEYRSHLQPRGRKTQWFDLLHEEAGVNVAYHPGDFRPVEITMVLVGKTRALAS